MTASTRWRGATARWLQPLQARWRSLSPREQGLLQVLGTVLLLALLWIGAIAPPLHSLRDSESRRAALAASHAQMQVWQAQAQAVQQQPRLNAAQAAQALQSLTQAAGAGWQLQVLGERATLQVSDATPEALAQWLLQAREQAQSLPVQAQLESHNASAERTSEPRWRGRLVLALPHSDRS